MGTCALVAASDFNARHFQAALDAGTFDAVWAVDAGYAHLTTLGCVPDMALGDFDSLGFTPACAEVREYPSHKDKSDLEIAFDLVVQHGFDHVVVYGALGQRLDHTIANLQMCARFAEASVDVALVDADSVVRIVVGPATCELPALESGTVSVFSATPCAKGVVERGLEYPLDGVELTNRTTLGLSNELIGQTASVSVEEGTLYVICPC